MKVNTVVLDTKEYTQLREFYNGIKEGKYVFVDSYNKSISVGEEKHVIRLLKKQINDTKKRANSNRTKNNKSIYDASKMNLWQFLKWRKKC